MAMVCRWYRTLTGLLILTGYIPSCCGENSSCLYGYEDIESVDASNITEEDELAWPCELREYWAKLSPLVHLVQSLLSYGTTAIVALGLLLNTLTICVLKSKKMRAIHSSTSIYLMALACYDSCVLIFNFMVGVLRAQYPLTVNRVFQDNQWLCVTHSVCVELFNLLSIWMIICFTVERLIVVCFPLVTSKYCSVRRARVVLTLISLAILIISSHKIFVSGFEGDSVFGYKACLTNRAKFSNIIYFYVAFNTWLPAVVIVLLNIIIGRKLYTASQVRKRLSVSKEPSQSRRRVQIENKITKTLLIISAVYVILLLPLGLVQMIELWVKTNYELSPSSDLDPQKIYIHHKRLHLLLKWLRGTFFFFYQFNFGVNFFIYVFSNKKFRSLVSSKFPGFIGCQLKSYPAGKSINAQYAMSKMSGSSAVNPAVSVSTINSVLDNYST